MINIELHRAEINDLQHVQQIGRKTFIEAFGAVNTEANMNAYLAKSFSDAQVVSELSNPNSQFYLAKLGDRVAGYLKVNFGPAQTEKQQHNAMEIERIYVLKDFQGQQVGQQLFDKAMELAHQQKVAYVWLGVWEKNQKAINFYRKNGFTEFDRHIFMLGDDPQTDLMMKLDLTLSH